jgi:hypothetical protein
MRKYFYGVFLSAVMCGCVRGAGDIEQIPQDTRMTDEQRVSYAENTLGITIDKRQDWMLSQDYKVCVVANAALQDIKKVSILTGNPYLESVQVLASMPVTDNGKVDVTFRAPLSNKLLHAACVNSKGEMHTAAFVAGDDSVYLVKPQTSKSVKAMTRGIVDEQTVTVDDELSYTRWNRTDYPELQQEALLFVPLSSPNNRPQVEALNNHSLETDGIGGQVTMTFLGGRVGNTTTHIGYRIYPKNDPSNVQTYILDDDYDAGSDDDAMKYYQVDETKQPVNYSGRKVALVWRDHTGNLKDALPDNMHIDFFVVVDGQDLSDEPLRVTVYSVNNHTYLSCEDGSDNSFNDKMFYIEEGIVTAPVAPEIEPLPVAPQVWTYAWEDTEKGDYDLNDCVIRVSENQEDPSLLDVTLLALGAHYDLKVYFAANNEDVFGGELHSLLGVQQGTMINTSKKDIDPITVTRQKPAGFDFQTNAFKLEVKLHADDAPVNGLTSYEVTLPTKGQDPHAIAIPENWAWPTERTSIIAAYPRFRDWAQDVTNTEAQDWYMYPAEGKTIHIE